MGKLIVTTGNYAKTGYLLKNTKQNIYSIEELCYCIMQNPELCDDYLYDEGLARYIRESLGLKERGALLADFFEQFHDVCHTISSLLSSEKSPYWITGGVFSYRTYSIIQEFYEEIK